MSTQDTINFSLYLPRPFYRKLKHQSNDCGSTMNSYIKTVLQKHLKEIENIDGEVQ